MNKFIGLGNLTRDPKFREIKGDNKVCDFAIAINNKASNSVFYIDVETWNKVAENCNRFLSKGRKVLVEGKLNMSTWQTKSGENRTRIFCRADTVTFLDKTEEQASSGKQESEEIEDEFADVPF
ncbi:MAG: single-stranded DNA-binding protein [Crocinitomicaceae bacterium]|nr:single-stranded DNA-binding protein [Crocinitomicaceae bacterium]|tara:strand:+ start:1553 stop:1924 length:372 start_codon:yes stop_codon:yes gene_type:complete